MFSSSAEIYDLLYRDKDYVAEAAAIHDVIAVRRPAAQSLLDVACGTGRHLAAMRQWYEVAGVDMDAGLLDVARGRLPDVPLYEADMRDFDLGRTFDVVTCLFSSIAYVQTLDQVERAVANMARHLSPGGLMFVESWPGPETFKPTFPGRLLMYEDDSLQVVRMSVSRMSGKRSMIDFHYLVARPGEIEHRTETHTMGLFTDDEYRSAFAAAGLTAEKDDAGPSGRGLWICEGRA